MKTNTKGITGIEATYNCEGCGGCPDLRTVLRKETGVGGEENGTNCPESDSNKKTGMKGSEDAGTNCPESSKNKETGAKA